MILIMLFLQMPVDSLSLEQAIDYAFEKSPVYHESRLSLEKTRILYHQSLSNLLPAFSSSLTYTRSTYHSIDTDTYSGSVTINQPLLDLDIISAALIAGKTLGGTRLQHEAQMAQIILQIKTAYYNLINAYKLMQSSEVAIKRAQENVKLIEAKYELGTASRLEKLQGEVFLLRAQSDQAQAKKLQIMANEELKSIIGETKDIYPTDSLGIPDSAIFPPLDSLVTVLQEVNYSILVAKEAKTAARLDLISSYLAVLPRVHFFYGYNYSSDSLVFDFQHMEDNTSRNYGISISIPLFEVKTLIFEHLKARKELQKQTYAEQQVLYETEKSLRTTYTSLLQAYDEVQLSVKSLDAATEAAAIAREQYALGLISFLDFVSSEKDLYETRVAYTSSLSDFYIQRATLSFLLASLPYTKEK